jgi:hypothetical protein
MSTFKVFTFFLIIGLMTFVSSAQVTSFSEKFDATSGNTMPANWSGAAVSGANYGTGNFYADHTSGTGRFAWESNGYITSMLVAAGTYNILFYIRISSTPAEDVKLGYSTNPADIAGTFILLQTILNTNSNWTYYSYSFTLPVNAYITWNCAGTSKTHCIDDVVLTSLTNIKENRSMQENFSVFHSPADEKINIQWNAEKSGDVEFMLKDIGGRTLTALNKRYFPAGQNFIAFNTGDISNGLYFIAAKRDDRIISVQKIMILH